MANVTMALSVARNRNGYTRRLDAFVAYNLQDLAILFMRIFLKKLKLIELQTDPCIDLNEASLLSNTGGSVASLWKHLYLTQINTLQAGCSGLDEKDFVASPGGLVSRHTCLT